MADLAIAPPAASAAVPSQATPAQPASADIGASPTPFAEAMAQAHAVNASPLVPASAAGAPAADTASERATSQVIHADAEDDTADASAGGGKDDGRESDAQLDPTLAAMLAMAIPVRAESLPRATAPEAPRAIADGADTRRSTTMPLPAASADAGADPAAMQLMTADPAKLTAARAALAALGGEADASRPLLTALPDVPRSTADPDVASPVDPVGITPAGMPTAAARMPQARDLPVSVQDAGIDAGPTSATDDRRAVQGGAVSRPAAAFASPIVALPTRASNPAGISAPAQTDVSGRVAGRVASTEAATPMQPIQPENDTVAGPVEAASGVAPKPQARAEAPAAQPVVEPQTGQRQSTAATRHADTSDRRAAQKSLRMVTADVRLAERPMPDAFAATGVDASASSVSAPASSVAPAGDQLVNGAVAGAASDRWLDRLAHDIAQTGGADSQLSFRLDPAHLGPLSVHIAQGAEGASVRMSADNAHARAALADAQPRLAAEARAQGLTLRETSVDVGGGQSGGQGGSPRGQAGLFTQTGDRGGSQQRQSSPDQKTYQRTIAPERVTRGRIDRDDARYA